MERSGCGRSPDQRSHAASGTIAGETDIIENVTVDAEQNRKIISTDGDNSYSHHTGSSAAHSSPQRKGELHDRQFPVSDVRRAEEKMKEFE